MMVSKLPFRGCSVMLHPCRSQRSSLLGRTDAEYTRGGMIYTWAGWGGGLPQESADA